MADSILTWREGHVGWVSFNRPEKRNALDPASRAQLDRIVAELDADAAVRVIVLTGEGSAFCAGTDLSSAQPDDRHVLARSPRRLAAAIEECGTPVIAAVNGPAAGGGFEFALAADLRVATPSARFLLPEVRIGSLPGSGGTQRIFSALPSAIAWKALLSGLPIGAEDALRFGLVSDLFDEQSFREQVSALAARIAEGAPLSLRAAKTAGRAALGAGQAGFELERSLWSALAETEDRAEGRAAFREKRDPRYHGK